MKITLEWLEKRDACQEAVEAWKEKGESDPITVIQLAMDRGRFDWANWLIVRCMTYKQYVGYAIFAAEQVLDIYEKKYPDDNRPRMAIEAAKNCVEKASKRNKDAAAYAAYAAARAAYAAADAASYAAADAAAYAAGAAANAARATYAAGAARTANAAYAAANAARKSIQDKIIEYGITALRGGEE